MKKLKMFVTALLCLSCLLVFFLPSYAETEIPADKVLIEYHIDPDYEDTCELYMGGGKGSVFTRELPSGGKLTAFGVWACEKGNPKNNSKVVEMSLLNDISGLTDKGAENSYKTGDIISVFDGRDAKVSTENGFMFTHFYAETTPKIIINVRPEITMDEPEPITNLKLDNAYVFGDGKAAGTSTTMSAARDVSREELCAMIGRILYQNGYYNGFRPNQAPQYRDVSEDLWSYKHLAYMAAQGAYDGKSQVNPAGLITRGESAHIMSCALHLNKQADLSRFTDMDPEHPYYSDIAKMVAAGYMQGDDNSCIHPDDNITRAEVTAIINRIIGRDSSFYKLMTKSGEASSAYYTFPDLEKEGAEGAWYYEDMIRAASAYDAEGYIDPALRTTREDLDN